MSDERNGRPAAPAVAGSAVRSLPRAVSRRALLIGTGAVAAGGTGLAIATAWGRRTSSPGSQGTAAAATGETPTVVALSDAPTSTPQRTTQTPRAAPSAASPTAAPTAAPRRTPIADALRSGYALVASPRLPLPAVGPQDPERLLGGAIDDWRAVGSPVALPVERLALAGDTIPGIAGAEQAADYDALANELWARPGALALVPLDAIDFRVQTLTVGGIDPLTVGEGIEPALRVGVVGDIVPGRNVHLHMERYGDYTRPFHRVASLLRGFDLTVANLEGNLSATLPQPEDDHSFSFVSSPAMLDGFALAGIDAVTLANNHSVWNDEGWGVQGLLDTMGALESAGLPYFGAGYDLEGARAPWTAMIGGTSISWLGIDGVTANYEVTPGAENGVVDFDAGATADRPGTNPYLSAQFLADISAAAASSAVVIPYFHMGAEYVAIPPAWAVAGARAAIDAGATMVVTNHPHVIQGMEIHNGRPIVYSPGNFIIDQMWGVEVRSGYALEVLLRGSTVVGLRVHGTEIEEFHQPRPMSGGEQANLLDRFWASVDRLAERRA